MNTDNSYHDIKNNKSEIPPVSVLLSACNGEKYLKDQVDSIFSQTYKNIILYVRDDGSTDGTWELLNKLQKKYGSDRMNIIKGKNKGFGKSFMELLKYADEGDYWAFSDQDDVWFPEKIERGVKWLTAEESRYAENSQLDGTFYSREQNGNLSKCKFVPLMYHSAFKNVDESLNPLNDYLPPKYRYDFRRSITDCLHMGFSDIINKDLRSMMLEGDPKILTTHDHWAEMLVMEFGKVYFDPHISCLHRRLNSSISGLSMKNRIRWLIGAMKGDYDFKSCVHEFKIHFYDKMKQEDRKFIWMFSIKRGHYNIAKQFAKAFYPKRWRPSLSSELVMRTLMLIGKI
ncbi:MAG: glycosyltransferase [Lachnospiraceae bacterium]|jgi:glycosyltransferase involved in cell wall biosynthesis|nr:glycosyltransferase [Lachnospiraceae bacterium]MEE3460937.1 glycosyltransferase [Lachnospiraceae bacterium]